MHRRLEQKLPAGQETPAQALACATGSLALQMPSDWQMPSPQSALVVQPILPAATEHESSVCGSHAPDAFLSTPAAAANATVRIETFPHPILHLPTAPRRLVTTAPPGKRGSGRSRPMADKSDACIIPDRRVRNRESLLTDRSSNRCPFPPTPPPTPKTLSPPPPDPKSPPPARSGRA